MARGDALVFGHHHLAGFVGDVETGHFATQPFGHKLHLRATVHQAEVVVDKEVGQDGFRCQSNRLEQNGHGHLAAAVHPEKQHIFGVELKVQPRATVGNDPGREQQLAGAVCLAFVVLKEHARRAVQLGHDHPLGSIDDE